MQSISLGSLKLEAHHDKIINEVAHTTKLYFFSKELDFLRELRSQAQDLQTLAKPRLEPHDNLTEFRDKAQRLRETLEREVILTRRQIAHLEMQSSNHFEGRVQACYEKAVVEINSKLQIAEALVQKRQDFNKSNSSFQLQRFVGFKDKSIRLLLEKYLQKKEEVKREIKRRLIFGGLIKDKKELLDRSLLRWAKKQKLSSRCYHYFFKDKQYYKSKSLDRRQFEPHVGDRLRGELSYKQPRWEISLKTNKDYQQISVKRSLLVSLQEDIFEQDLQNFKNANNKLQIKIELLKKAIQRKEASRTLRELSQEKQIQTERAKARQILAYMQMQQSFKNKLEACSYRWTTAKHLISNKNVGKCKEWAEQYEHYPEWLYIKRQRAHSTDHPKPEIDIKRLPLKLQGFKSNERTNTSHERL